MLEVKLEHRVGESRRSGSWGAPIMSSPRRAYLAYLLRLWQVWEGENALWRASLESPQTGERRGFANLPELFTFLETEARRAVHDEQPPNRGEKGGDIDNSLPLGTT